MKRNKFLLNLQFLKSVVMSSSRIECRLNKAEYKHLQLVIMNLNYSNFNYEFERFKFQMNIRLNKLSCVNFFNGCDNK